MTNKERAQAVVDMLTELLEKEPEICQEIITYRSAKPVKDGNFLEESPIVFGDNDTLGVLGLLNGVVSAMTDSECCVFMCTHVTTGKITGFTLKSSVEGDLNVQ